MIDTPTGLTVCCEDNLATLRRLVAAGERFDLVELDGPYGAGLEPWDTLDDAAYVAHYADRLTLVRQVLQPWGVVFLFGYPEQAALVRAWAHATGTLHLRRWLTWYVQQTAHEGRRVQSILMFVLPGNRTLLSEFQQWLTTRRRTMGLTIVQCHQQTGIRPYARGGFLWFESEAADAPTPLEYLCLKTFFAVPDRFDGLQSVPSYDGLTNLDFLTVPVERAAQLSADLRSKPIGLYDTLFRPVVPPTAPKRALILYGGSGNAAVAAGRLGYAVTVCEQDAARCTALARRWAALVERRATVPVREAGPLFAGLEGVA